MIKLEFIIGPASALAPKPVEGEEFVCVIQQYTWWRGSDVATWRRDAEGKCTRSVYATGPVNVDIVPEGMLRGLLPREVKEVFNATIARLTDKYLDVLGGQQLDWYRLLAAVLFPLRDEVIDISVDDFEQVKGIASTASEGCVLLGCEFGWSIIARTAAFSFDADTCSGSGRSQEFLDAAHELTRLAGVQELPERMLSLESILKQLRIEAASG